MIEPKKAGTATLKPGKSRSKLVNLIRLKSISGRASSEESKQGIKDVGSTRKERAEQNLLGGDLVVEELEDSKH